MTPDRLGQLFAILAAINWAFALILFKRSGESVPPLALNIFKNTVGIVLLVFTLIFAGSRLGDLSLHPREEVYILILSGVLGIALADTVFFYALNLCGVGIISIVDCTYSLFAILFGCLLIAEEMTPSRWLGAGLIVAGVLLSSRHAPPPNRTRLQIVIGVLCGALAMAMMVFSIVWAKPVLTVQRFPLIWAVMIRMLAGTGVLALFAVAVHDRARHWACFKPSAVWKMSIPASILGAYLSMIFWVGGFQYASASVAGVLNQTSVVFAVILAAIFLKERLTLRKVVALTLALAGVATVTFDGWGLVAAIWKG